MHCNRNVFDVEDDVLNLSFTATDFTDVSSVLAAAQETGSGDNTGLLIDLGDNNRVFLKGLTLNDLNQLNIEFG